MIGALNEIRRREGLRTALSYAPMAVRMEGIELLWDIAFGFVTAGIAVYSPIRTYKFMTGRDKKDLTNKLN